MLRIVEDTTSTLMTGQHTGHTPVRNNGLSRYLYDTDVTVAEVLEKAGYATGGFGKWGLGRENTAGVAAKQGFDVWFGQYSQTQAHFYYPYYLMHNLERHPLPENEQKKRGTYAQDAIHERALRFIEGKSIRTYIGKRRDRCRTLFSRRCGGGSGRRCGRRPRQPGSCTTSRPTSARRRTSRSITQTW
ncbi:MAG: sulfatase-like hydrolase/transferase [Luteitalea sp.]|nr:sulfatase-like hydrolase/transferase [Luteitalea sp.]